MSGPAGSGVMDVDDLSWPAIPLAEWAEACATLHRWPQIVGKIRMAQTPPVNHWWHSTFMCLPAA